jgi:DNA-binding CsgD family transcriptional regulator/tetratricopeptide (TPR) repeat protein
VDSLRFFGRTNELSSILGTLERLALGKGAAVLICGEPGIGKTRLVREARRASSTRMEWAIAHCPQEYIAPFAPILDALETLSISLAQSDVLKQSLADPLRKFRFCQAILSALEQKSKSAGIVLFLDDIQWADPETVEFLALMYERLERQPIGLIITCRTADLLKNPLLAPLIDRILHGEVQKIELSPLSRSELKQIATDALDEARGAISEERLIQILRLADGNPLYLRELVRAAMAHERFGIPDPIQMIAESRMRSFEPAIQQIALVAAAFGEDFSTSDLAYILEEPVPEVIAGLQHLCMSQLIAAESDGRYRFSHALLREAIYGMITADFAQELHQKIAMRLANHVEHTARTLGAQAFHYQAAGNRDVAFHCNVAAGNAAMNTLGYGAAAEYFKRALDLVDAGVEAGKVSIPAKLAGALTLNGRTAMAIVYYERAIEELGIDDTDHKAELVRGLARAFHDSGDIRQSVSVIAEFAESLGGKSQLPADLVILAAKSEFNAAPGNLGPWFEHATSVMGGLDPSSRYYLDTLAASRCYMMGDIAEAERLLEEGIRGARELGDRGLLIRILVRKANEQSTIGKVREALRASEEAFRLTCSIPGAGEVEHVTRVFGCCTYASELFRAGRLAEARLVMDQIEDLTFDTSIARVVAEAIRLRIEAVCSQEPLPKASLQTLPRLMKSAVETMHDGTIAAVAEAVANFYYTRGRADEAQTVLHDALGAMHNGLEAHEMLLLVAEMGSWQDVAVARSLLEEGVAHCLETKRVAYTSLFEAFAYRRQGNRSTMQRRARRAGTLLEQLGEGYRFARALELAGDTQKAAVLFEEMGARFYAQRASRGLRSETAATLTPRQEELRQLVSSGLSNAEIADQLGISVGTVRVQLTSIFKKLGIRSRGQLLPSHAGQVERGNITSSYFG